VEARFADDRAPRIAVHREGFGCTLLPADASPADADALPRHPPSPPAGDVSALAWPDGDLVPPAEPGAVADPARLDRALTAAFDAETYGEATRTIAVVVVHRGRLVVERYRPGFGPHTTYRTWSVAKSITNALVGVLIGEGRLEVEAPAPVPEWQSPGDPRAAITIGDLLHMSSGLERAGAESYAVYFGGMDAVSEITSARLEAEPGTRWHYANRDTLLLVRAMRHVLGDDESYWTFPRRALFDRIGMRSTVAEVDWRGNFVLSSQVQSTARDLARFGLLYLQDGTWNGVRILPPGWVRFSATPAPARSRGVPALVRYGLQGLLGYGAHFWLLEKNPVIAIDAVSALGSRGQCVTIVPQHELVVVRTGLDSETDGVVWRQDRFVADVIGSLPGG
jgi:CubicO group peptidase (beta-lactamase class C family)